MANDLRINPDLLGQQLIQALRTKETEQEAEEYALRPRYVWNEALPAVFEQSSAPKFLFPSKVADAIGEYLGSEKSRIMAAVNFPRFIDFTNKEILKTCFAESCRADVHFSCATVVAKRVYEVALRNVGKDGKWGKVFPMDPEVLACAMKLAKGEIVLEIASASGENGILLAFSDAQRVYVNDCDEEEVDNFQSLKETLPKSVQKRLKMIKGSCFEIPKKVPEIRNKVGLLICRNFLHFSNTEQEKQFFDLLANILKPGGRGIFMVNSVYAYRNWRQKFEAAPRATSWEITRCILTGQGVKGEVALCEEALPCKEELVGNGYSSATIYKASKGSWQEQEKFKELPPEVQTKVKNSLARNQIAFGSFTGSLHTVVIRTRLYNRETLPALFDRHGFEVEETFAVKTDGHLLLKSDFHDGGQQIGVVVRRPTSMA